jgi:hypothetical protein
VAILVDEAPRANAEFTTMALRTAPENRVIGSQTAGADGNVTYLTRPCGERTGLFRQSQRAPTDSDRAERDVIAGTRE